ncbi:MAG: acetate--CoA ligase [Pelagibacterales bacterium]|nr:acetate--CoA ligase [Pelagibacterales bacterium]
MFHVKSKDDYNKQYNLAIRDVDGFWGEVAKNFSWFKEWEKVSNCDLEKAQIEWFVGGKTNISYNCLDRHLDKFGDKVAIIWEANDPKSESKKITYKELYQEVCRFSNMLKAESVKKGDRVVIYMPMIPEALFAMLACARIGAIHCVVFAGFSSQALFGRIKDSEAKVVITSDLLLRGDKKINLLQIVNEAVKDCEFVESIIVYKRLETEFETIKSLKYLIWQDEVRKYSNQHKAEICDSEDPLFILYTSGSTGKPKGILHTNAGYMVYGAYSFKNVFQYQEDDVHFCTADIGWITGHSYLVYGPLLNAATTVMFEGIPSYPNHSRFWQIIEKYKINIFYTAPTAIRALIQKGDEFVKGFDLSSLKTLGTVGEPINEEAWQWFFDKIGNKKCPIVDTWWQTETGGILISSMARVFDSKPAFAGLPLPGVVPVLLNDMGNEIVESNKVGNLSFKQAWPSMARGIWGDKNKFFTTYYEQFTGNYCAGDGALRNEDGLFRIIGRTDDVIKVSGHRLGTAEIEEAINSHKFVSESAVVGVPHEIKGECIYAFLIVKNIDVNLEKEVSEIVVKQIGAIARPEKIYVVLDLPKTRSGKIMRRILKKIVNGEKDYGDISTLLNPEAIDSLSKVVGRF